MPKKIQRKNSATPWTLTSKMPGYPIFKCFPALLWSLKCQTSCLSLDVSPGTWSSAAMGTLYSDQVHPSPSSSHPSPGATDHLVKAVGPAPRGPGPNHGKACMSSMCHDLCDTAFPATRSSIRSNPTSQSSLWFILCRPDWCPWWHQPSSAPDWRQKDCCPWEGKGHQGLSTWERKTTSSSSLGWTESWKYNCAFKD